MERNFSSHAKSVLAYSREEAGRLQNTDILPEHLLLGIIRDGGLVVRYCLCNDLTACAGTSHGAADIPTMFYGHPQNVELDLFSGYEVSISRDFAFTSLLDTILGDAEVGAGVVAYKGFSTLIIPHS